jgi:hypothetical protein
MRFRTLFISSPFFEARLSSEGKFEIPTPSTFKVSRSSLYETKQGHKQEKEKEN